MPERNRRRALPIAFGLLSVLVITAILGGPKVFDFVRYERVFIRQEIEGDPAVGFRWVPRWGRERFVRIKLWSESTGFLVYEGWPEEGGGRRDDYWRPDGTLYQQTRLGADGRGEARVEPPWFEGGANQSEPTSPWWPERPR